MPRRINAAGKKLVMEFEGLRLAAYRCPAGLWTIGYGHTATVYSTMTVTADEAAKLLDADLRRAADHVTDLVRVELSNNQFAALTAFCFNVGPGALAGSTLRQLLNRGWYSQVPVQLKRWCKIKGRIMQGLVRRRAAEATLWQLPDKIITQTI